MTYIPNSKQREEVLRVQGEAYQEHIMAPDIKKFWRRIVLACISIGIYNSGYPPPIHWDGLDAPNRWDD